MDYCLACSAPVVSPTCQYCGTCSTPPVLPPEKFSFEARDGKPVLVTEAQMRPGYLFERRLFPADLRAYNKLYNQDTK